jgi:hypothetical protein
VALRGPSWGRSNPARLRVRNQGSLRIRRALRTIPTARAIGSTSSAPRGIGRDNGATYLRGSVRRSFPGNAWSMTFPPNTSRCSRSTSRSSAGKTSRRSGSAQDVLQQISPYGALGALARLGIPLLAPRSLRASWAAAARRRARPLAAGLPGQLAPDVCARGGGSSPTAGPGADESVPYEG